MPLFGRRKSQVPDPPRGGLSADTRTYLEALARSKWSPDSNPWPADRTADLFLMAQANRDGFLRDLAAICFPVGGWAALGGKYVVTDVLPITTDTPEFNAIVLAAFEFLRQNGVPPNRLSPNDVTLWRRVSSNRDWLIWRDPPAGPPTPLALGEVRLVQKVRRADGYINEVFVSQGAHGSYIAKIIGPSEDGEPDDEPFNWFELPTLQDLYVRIGEAQQTPPMWSNAELFEYYPLPPPTI